MAASGALACEPTQPTSKTSEKITVDGPLCQIDIRYGYYHWFNTTADPAIRLNEEQVAQRLWDGSVCHEALTQYAIVDCTSNEVLLLTEESGVQNFFGLDWIDSVFPIVRKMAYSRQVDLVELSTELQYMHDHPDEFGLVEPRPGASNEVIALARPLEFRAGEFDLSCGCDAYGLKGDAE